MVLYKPQKCYQICDSILWLLVVVVAGLNVGLISNSSTNIIVFVYTCRLVQSCSWPIEDKTKTRTEPLVTFLASEHHHYSTKLHC